MTAYTDFDRIRSTRSAKAEPTASPRRLAGIVTAGALTLSLILATALPARAGDRGDDLAKALIGAVIIGAIIHEANRDDDVVAPAPVHGKKRPFIHDDTARNRIPAVCALQFSDDRRTQVLYPERCLRREGVRGRLPERCATEVRFRGKWDRAYSERCLRKAGFEIGGKRHRY